MTDNHSENQGVIEGEAIVVREAAMLAAAGGVQVRRDPQTVLQEGQKAAQALMQVLATKKKPVIMNGERYLENDDWQVIGRFHGCTVYIESVRFQIYEVPGVAPIFGFDAVALLKAPDGRVISRAEASCLSDEEKWGSRPKYAVIYAKRCKVDAQGHKIKDAKGNYLVEEWHEPGYEPESSELVWVPRPNAPAGAKNIPLKSRKQVGTENVSLAQMKSMSETRASSKVLSMVFRYVPVMAGVQPTPAEEMTHYQPGGASVDTTTGELTEPVDERFGPPVGQQTSAAKPAAAPAKADKKPAAEKPAEKPPADKKKAAEKPAADAPAKGNPVYKGGKDEPAPPARGTKEAAPVETEAVVITEVLHGKNAKGEIWKVTYVDAKEQEHVAITDDKEIADVCEDYWKGAGKGPCLLTAKQGKLKYPEIEEIGPVQPAE